MNKEGPHSLAVLLVFKFAAAPALHHYRKLWATDSPPNARDSTVISL